MTCAKLLTLIPLCWLLAPEAHGAQQDEVCSDARYGVSMGTCDKPSCDGSSCTEEAPRPWRQLLQVGAEVPTAQTITSKVEAPQQGSKEVPHVTTDSKAKLAIEKNQPPSKHAPARKREDVEVLVVVIIILLAIFAVLMIAFFGTRRGESTSYESSSEGETVHSKQRYTQQAPVRGTARMAQQPMNRSPPSAQRMVPPPMAPPPINRNAPLPPRQYQEQAPPRAAREWTDRFSPEPAARSPYKTVHTGELAPMPAPMAAPMPMATQTSYSNVQVAEPPAMSAYSSGHLCPGLVVPDGSDCVLAVPTFRTLMVPPRDSAAFFVRDLNGGPMIQGEILRADWSGAATTSPIVTLRTALSGADHATIGERQFVLAYVKASIETGGSRSVYVYGGQGDIFAHLARDPFRSCYVLTSSRMGKQVIFAGDFATHHVNITSDNNEQMADVEPCAMNFDPPGEYFRIRVFSQVDVGLVLCGLLAVQHIEAS